MSLVPTNEEIMESLRKQVESLKQENKLLKAIISTMNGKRVCTCGIDRRGCAKANDWIKCPVHGKSTMIKEWEDM